MLVVEDGHHPLRDDVRPLLEAEGATIETSHFRRRGNLRGKDCVRGMWKIFEHLASSHDTVAKIDSDMIMLKEIEEPLASHWTGPKQCLFGCFYQLPSAFILKQTAEKEYWGQIFRTSQKPIPEDIFTRKLIRAEGMQNDVHSLTYAGEFAAFFGDRNSLPRMIGGSLILCWMRERPWTQDRSEIAELMSEILKLAESSPMASAKHPEKVVG